MTGKGPLLAACTLLALCGGAAQLLHADAPGDVRVQVTHVSTRRSYRFDRAVPGAKIYIDRAYVIRQLPPALTGKVLLQTANEDDFVDAAHHLGIRLATPAQVHVCVDARGTQPAGWLADWKPTDDRVVTSDATYRVYQRKLPAGEVKLGGNERKRTGACSNYFVIVDLRGAEAGVKSPVRVTERVDFARTIHPLLEGRCFRCHGAGRQEGGLRLDVRRRALLGGDSGPAIVPGETYPGELLRRVTATGDARMPPSGQPLSAGEVALLRGWIEQGAAWPDALAGREVFPEHWAFRTVARPAVPAVRDPARVRGPVDAFVLARLERQGLGFSPEADRRTLIRRLCLDLVGLPPAPGEVASFVGDGRADAYERLVDRLLASPHFGERWGRHWLDLARFAESDGYENDRLRPDAWRFRDWVVDAFSRDLPFDQFTLEQLAGDLLPGATPEQRMATGFHCNTLWNSAASADKEEFRTRAVKDRTDTTGLAWMGLTLGCAQCHSHKYDPLTQREYYQLYAFFNGTEGHDMPIPGGKAPALRAVQRTTHIHKHGSFLARGAEVKPATPAFLPPLQPRGEVADRLDLARWLIRPDHPLTARVAVSRFWQHLFGQGLVPTPENFGRNGSPPDHPELLDWLASELVRQRWSRKALLRQIVLSSTYRQASSCRDDLARVDPQNRLLGRQNRFRVEAEVVRDLALSVSGLLRPTMGGPSVVPPFPEGFLGQDFTHEALKRPGGERYRRGVYIHVQRTLTFPMLAAFDVADGNQPCVRRDRSTTPLQALTLLNDPVFSDCARALGSRLRRERQTTEERLDRAFTLCLARLPRPEEREVLLDLVRAQGRLGASEEAVWNGVARTILNLEEFITRE